MVNQKENFFIRNRYSIAVFVLLNLACLIVILLVVARVAYSDTGRHTGLVWNLFLAWIPFMLAYFAHMVSWAPQHPVLHHPGHRLPVADLLPQRPTC